MTDTEARLREELTETRELLWLTLNCSACMGSGKVEATFWHGEKPSLVECGCRAEATALLGSWKPGDQYDTDGKQPRVDHRLLARMLIATARVAWCAANNESAGAEYGWSEMCLLAEQAGIETTVCTWDEIRAARARAIALVTERGLNTPYHGT